MFLFWKRRISGVVAKISCFTIHTNFFFQKKNKVAKKKKGFNATPLILATDCLKVGLLLFLQYPIIYSIFYVR